jgi:uncharacterized lipoprotein YddW (UPF0748 family)
VILAEQYLRFRRDNITRLVEAVSREARRIKPGIKVSAAVFWHWTSARNQVAQDWKLWVEKGYLDFVCPMDYTPNNARFQTLVESQRKWAGKVPFYPGIGLSTWDTRDLFMLFDQIRLRSEERRVGKECTG